MRGPVMMMMMTAILGGCDAESSSSMVLFDALSNGNAGVIDLALLGPVRLGPDGPVVAEGTGEPAGRNYGGSAFSSRDALTLPVVDDGPRPGVRWHDDFVELVVFVEREDAITWTVAPTAGGLAPNSQAVVFEPGVQLEQLDQTEEARLVRYAERDFWLDAWVPIDDADQVRDVEPFAGQATVGEGRVVWVRPNTDLFDGPSGPWMGRFEPEIPNFDYTPGPVAAEKLGNPVGGYMPVRWAAPGVDATVWVAEDRLTKAPSGLGGWGRGGSFGCGCGGWFSKVVLPEGTELYDGIDGRQVGVILQDYTVSSHLVGEVHGAGWQTFSTATPWGEVDVWLPPDAVQAPLDR